MIKYEKVNDDYNLPIRLIRFEGDIGQPVHKHWHNSLEIVLQKMWGKSTPLGVEWITHNINNVNNSNIQIM